MIPTSTSEHYRAQQRLQVVTLAATRRTWAKMTPDFDASWASLLPSLMALTTASQLASARQGAEYLPKVLSETDQPDRPEGRVAVAALAGVSSDGRPLDSLLYGAVTSAKAGVGASLSPAEALERGGRWLDMAVASLVTDAARSAVSVGMVARPQIGGYVRMLNLPSCSRCAVLAGKWFKWNEGFLRHPRCDCRHIPSSENLADNFTTDPRKAVEAGQVRGLTDAERQAIGDGADVSQVVNSRRGMRSMTVAGRKVSITTEGTTSRGVYGRAAGARDAQRVLPGDRYRRARTVRLTPESIYREAANREDAIRLLKRFGYLT